LRAAATHFRCHRIQGEKTCHKRRISGHVFDAKNIRKGYTLFCLPKLTWLKPCSAPVDSHAMAVNQLFVLL
jgi:hypothetical protein